MAVDLQDKRRLAIVANVERLISDALVLLEHGSAASALATAILAFEEAGKGHRLELDIQKSKLTPSWHQFRQVIAAFVLSASLFQKYGLSQPKFDDRAREMLDERWAGVKRLDELTKKPMPKELLEHVVAIGVPGYESLTGDQKTIFRCELRWIRKIIIATFAGEVEKERQSGMYVDIFEGDVVSDPANITRQRAYYWIRVAERTLKILRNGDYQEPYGELAAFLEAQPKPLPQGDDLAEAFTRLQSEAADFIAEFQNSETKKKPAEQ